ncbi:unnamed protein product, partial [Rotaria sp. Silwood2]
MNYSLSRSDLHHLLESGNWSLLTTYQEV